MSTILMLLGCLFQAISRAVDSRTRRNYVYNDKDTFGVDLCDFVATMLEIKKSIKFGTIRDSEGNVYDIAKYPIPSGMVGWLRAGHTYLVQAAVDKAEALPTCVANLVDLKNGVKKFCMEQRLPGTVSKRVERTKDSDGNEKDVTIDTYVYEPSIMSPLRMEAFFDKLGVKVTDKCVRNADLSPILLSEFETVCGDDGGMYYIGGNISSETSYLCGLCAPKEVKPYLREVPAPTREECISWSQSVLF